MRASVLTKSKSTLVHFSNLLLSVYLGISRYLKQTTLRYNKNDIQRVEDYIDKLDASSYSQLEFLEFAQLIHRGFLSRVTRNDLSLLLAGCLYFAKTGKTPSVSHRAYVKAYESTGGLSQEVLHHALASPSDVQSKNKLYLEDLNFFSKHAVASYPFIVDELRNHGYATIEGCLNTDFLDSLNHEAASMKFVIPSSNTITCVDPHNPPNCNVCDALNSELQKSQLVSSLSRSRFLNHVTQDYFRSSSLCINTHLRYSFPAHHPSSMAAQYFHYDLDTLKWLKIFIYLSDVYAENGPHEYIAGTHKNGAKPPNLLARDYARISDQEIYGAFPGRSRKVVGPKGTIVFADTRCFHKGNPPLQGYRLMLTLIYSSTQLGYWQV